jgi:hypothetical protein
MEHNCPYPKKIKKAIKLERGLQPGLTLLHKKKGHQK